MTTNLTIAVGHLCNSNSKLAENSPYEVTKFPFGEDNKYMIVGTYFKQHLPYNAINLTELDKDEIMQYFESFKKKIIEKTSEEAFNTVEEYKQWIKLFEEAKAEVFVLITE